MVIGPERVDVGTPDATLHRWIARVDVDNGLVAGRRYLVDEHIDRAVLPALVRMERPPGLGTAVLGHVLSRAPHERFEVAPRANSARTDAMLGATAGIVRGDGTRRRAYRCNRQDAS